MVSCRPSTTAIVFALLEKNARTSLPTQPASHGPELAEMVEGNSNSMGGAQLSMYHVTGARISACGWVSKYLFPRNSSLINGNEPGEPELTQYLQLAQLC